MRARAGILAAVLCAAAGSCNGQSPPLDPLACADRVHCSWEGASARYVCVYAANTTALGKDCCHFLEFLWDFSR
eukprot:SAG31_NODE_37_length_31616_cov_38.688359_13_plen_74_part_00